MKKFLLYSLIVVFLISCKGKGTLEGNVYWKYNNYVGNRPDAGSSAYLYPFKRNSNPLIQTADINGNFKFEKIPSGQYLLLVESGNTTASSSSTLKTLLDNYPSLNKVFGIDLESINPKDLKEFEKQDSISSHHTVNFDTNNNSNSLNELQDEMNREKYLNDLAAKVLDKIPKENALAIHVLAHKISLNMVEIDKDNTDKKVIDFGTTYY